MKLLYKATWLISYGMLIIVFFPAIGQAQQSAFREQFIDNYKESRFTQQDELIKKNKDIIPGEIKSLIADAMSLEKTYDERIRMLGIAEAIAVMYKHWHKDEKPLVEVEIIKLMEVQKERERVATLEKWKKYEMFLGTFVLKEREVQMAAEGLTPVAFPHWLHRIWFQCKVCHEDIFFMKLRGNDISMAQIAEGKQCGVCHNGKIAFDSQEKGNCIRCHNLGRPEVEALYDVTKVDNKAIREVATRLGAEWNPENLSGGTIPLDGFGYFKWLELKEKKVFNPINSLKKDFKDEIRDNKILFETANPAIQNVIFDHKVHSNWIKCTTCHPSIFIDKLGGNEVKMTDMAIGKYCGYCHGKVSFTFSDCHRCHDQPKERELKDILIRKPKQ